MIRGSFHGSRYFGIGFPIGRACCTAAPEPFPENAPRSVVCSQALREEDVIQPVSQATGVKCSGAITHIKSRQRVAVDQGAVIIEKTREIWRLAARGCRSFIKISQNNNVLTLLNQAVDDLANGRCLSFPLRSASSRLRLKVIRRTAFCVVTSNDHKEGGGASEFLR